MNARTREILLEILLAGGAVGLFTFAAVYFLLMSPMLGVLFGG